MSEQDKIQLFENQPIRAAWDSEQEEWYFSIVDVIKVLTGSPNPQTYWRVMKKRLKDEGNENRIIKYKSILPTESQRLQEAAIINLSDLSVYAIEKKYDVNGEKTNYFTYLFLKCSSRLFAKIQAVHCDKSG